MSDDIRNVVINVSLKLADNKAMAPAVDQIRTATASVTQEEKKHAVAASDTNERLREAAQIEKLKLSIVKDQLNLESKKQTTQKAALDHEKEIVRLKQQQLKVSEAALSGAGTGKPVVDDGSPGTKTTKASGVSVGGFLGGIGGATAAILSLPTVIRHIDEVSDGIHRDLRGGRRAFKEGYFAPTYGAIVGGFDRMQGRTGRYNEAMYSSASDYQRPHQLMDIERAAREKLINALGTEISLRERSQAARQTITDDNFKLQHLDVGLIRQSEKSYGSMTALQRNEGMMLSEIRKRAGGIGGMTKEQRDAYMANPATGPLAQQEMEDEWRKPNKDRDRYNADLQRNAGVRDRVESALKATAVDLKLDQKLVVNISIQSLDKITEELRDKLLPEIIKMNQMIVAQGKTQLSAALVSLNLTGGISTIAGAR